ncbi:hypothetical protein ABIE26_001189 [Pedobacter africanus]|uniref:Uncharacterized protein n=1 Tax=Pedobacter africanus TaxID=151894 RepID=A0ACC6KSJ2_9SPHI|nr:hypothetical protein [Pedobacter africanus]MDR6782323.1 hypothetical protein [Pedobacter africanus]
MKSLIKFVLTSVLLVSLLVACTKQNVIDTGVSKAHFDGTIMQYLRQDDYNWKLTVQMIERAGLTDLFEGKLSDHKNITFLGFTSYTVLQYLYANKMDSVNQLSVTFCKETLLKHIVKRKILKEDVPFRARQYLIYAAEQPANKYLTMHTEGGAEIRAYLEHSDFAGVPDAGPVSMFLYSMTGNTFIPLASPNIQPNNGVVHSLGYNYILNNL